MEENILSPRMPNRVLLAFSCYHSLSLHTFSTKQFSIFFSFLFTCCLYYVFQTCDIILSGSFIAVVVNKGANFFKAEHLVLAVNQRSSFWVSSLPERIRVHPWSCCWVSTNKRALRVDDFYSDLYFSFGFELAFSFPLKSCCGPACSCELKAFQLQRSPS